MRLQISGGSDYNCHYGVGVGGRGGVLGMKCGASISLLIEGFTKRLLRHSDLHYIDLKHPLYSMESYENVEWSHAVLLEGGLACWTVPSLYAKGEKPWRTCILAQETRVFGV